MHQLKLFVFNAKRIYEIDTNRILSLNWNPWINLQLTSPTRLTSTAANLDSVNLSPPLLGKKAARNKVNKLDVDDNTITILSSICFNDIWYV